VPCHRQHPYRRFADRPLPVAEATADQIVSLPLYPHMTEAQVNQVCEALQEVAAEAVLGLAR
jgi:dTDP-4-amino-4,6-dideoxygalactose transaminase